MMRLAIIALLIAVPATVTAQLSKSDKAYLRAGIIEKVNALRSELGSRSIADQR